MDNQKQPTIIVKNYGCGSGCGTWIAAVAVLIFLGTSFKQCSGPSTQLPTPQSTATKTIPDPDTHSLRIKGTVDRHLGKITAGFSTADHAKAMLQLINDVADQREYRLNYQSDIDTVIIGVDFGKNVLVRMHNRPDGSGTAEKWSGHIIFRLNSAANGGSLNDTPNGKSPANYQTF